MQAAREKATEAPQGGLRDGSWLSHPPPGEEVCITGLAGSYPRGDSVRDLQHNLFNQVDMVTTGFRSNNYHPLLPERCGKIENVDKFDGAFFGVHFKQSEAMAVNLRKLLEKTYEAIVDAGMNPEELRGSRTGVFFSSSYAETEACWMYENLTPYAPVLSCVCATSWATHVSYWLGLTGPSYCVDTACSSSFYALDHAYQAIREGRVDQAIVGGNNMLLNPTLTVQFTRLGLMSPSGRSRTFDDDRDGYARSEAVAVMVLQRARDARRVYATLVHSKTNNDGYKDQGITYPNGLMQAKLMEGFYRECRIDPATVDWLESHGTGTRVGDPEELNSILSVFCKGRTSTLPISSVKTNLGHSETASGAVSISKVIIAMETGLIPPVLHFQNPLHEVPQISDGTLKVVDKTTPWKGGLVGISSFGFGGGNGHVLLRSNPRSKVNGGAPGDHLPRLVTFSSRTERGVADMLDDLESRPTDAEHVRLLHEVHAMRTEGHYYRGYTLLSHSGSLAREVQHCPKKSRQVWLVISDQDCAWTRVANSLLPLPVFAKAIDRCSATIKSKGVDVKAAIQANKTDSWAEWCVVRTATQLGLLEVLNTVGVQPDGVIASSAGKAAADYVGGRCTFEQALQAACSEGQAMAAKKSPVPNGIGKPACNGGVPHMDEPESPGYWSSRVMGERLLDSRPVSGKAAVTMEAAVGDVPRGSVLLGMAGLPGQPSSLRKGVLRIALHQGEKAGLTHLLTALGKLFLCGLDLRLAALYPAVQFPVSRGTPMISSLIGWQHSQRWNVVSFTEDLGLAARERKVEIDIALPEMKFYMGHAIDGRVLFPATGYLDLVWEMFAAIGGLPHNSTSVVFEDVRFLRATNLRTDAKVTFELIIQKLSGHFEVVEKGEPIVTGRISRLKGPLLSLADPEGAGEALEMRGRDVYKELRLRGYNYTGIFKSITAAQSSGRRSRIKWQDNWVAFMDNLLQTQILSQDTRGLFVPTAIERLSVDPVKHMNILEDLRKEGQDLVLEASAHPQVGVIQSGGVEVKGVSVSVIARRKPMGEPVLEKHVFVGNVGEFGHVEEAMRVCVHVALDTHLGTNIKAVEVVDGRSDQLLSPVLAAILGDLPLMQADVAVVSATADHPQVKVAGPGVKVETRTLAEVDDAFFVIASDSLGRSEVVDGFLACTKGRGFLISRERSMPPDAQGQGQGPLEVVNAYTVGQETIVLARKRVDLSAPAVVDVSGEGFSWLPALQAALKEKRPGRRVVALAQGEELSGVMGLVNCVRREPGGDSVRCVFITDPEAPPFDPRLPLYRDQLRKDVLLNVYRDGRWGGYRHLPLTAPAPAPATGGRTFPHAYVNTTTRGDLSSLRWLQGHIDPARPQVSKHQDLVSIYYGALNFRDVMIASGKLAGEVVVKERLQQDCMLCFEFSGRDSSGRRVMGLASSKCLSNLVVADKHLMWEVPQDWSLEDAATVPVTYATVLVAFEQSGCTLQRGVSLLIHAGSGGVGQAAIQLALRAGCTVFTTVGTPEKRDFLKKRFPQLTNRHIGNSRDSSFEQLVMAETRGKGVDVVLNSLAGELLHASVRCLGVGGRFLEIGKVDMVANTGIDLDLVSRKQISFHGILLDLFDSVETFAPPVDRLIRRCLAEGAMKPLTRTTFEADEVEQAFRFMAAGKHVGKVLVRVRPEEKERVVVPSPITMTALPRFFCDPDSSYVLVGGLGGFGLELADWLVVRGCRKLVLTSRTGLRNGYQASRVRAWRSYGVAVHLPTDDVTTEAGAERLLHLAAKVGPVAAIFNLAVVLEDGIFEQQTEARFAASSAPKARATQLLDRLSRRLCPALRHFVAFSSVSCGRGNAGQTNYGLANSVMERVCERRVADGLPGLAVQWGAVGDVGLLADGLEEHKEIVIGGTLQQSIGSCLHELDGFLSQGEPVVASMVVAEKRASGAGNLVEHVANMLGIRDVSTVSEHATLAELGVDSLLVVEMKQELEREYEVILSPREIRAMTFDMLAKIADRGPDAAPTDHKYEWDVAGFHFLVRAFSDREAAPRPVVALPSLGPGPGTPLFAVPGLEGMASIFGPLAARLRGDVIGLQMPNVDFTARETVREIAQDMLPEVVSRLGAGAPFRLLGYSMGGAVALELAALLEAGGRRGHLYLLDSSPDFLPAVLMAHLNREWDDALPADDNLQVNMLMTFLNYLKSEETPAFYDKHRTAMATLSWPERVELFLRLLPADSDYGHDYSVSVISAMWARMRALAHLDVSSLPAIRSRVTLVRPHYKGLKVDHDYGLGKLCERPVEVHLVDGDHASIVESAEVAAILDAGSS